MPDSIARDGPEKLNMMVQDSKAEQSVFIAGKIARALQRLGSSLKKN
jgi:hypothetical protein